MLNFFLYLGVFLLTVSLCIFTVISLSKVFKGLISLQMRCPDSRPRFRNPEQRKYLVLVAGLSLCLGFALSWLISGQMIFGFFLIGILPLLLSSVSKMVRFRQEVTLEKSAISYFYALRGLLNAGMSFPTALFELSQSIKTPFSEAMQLFLTRFQIGKTLPDCLDKFKKKSGLRLIGFSLAVFELAYRNGLAIVPFLNRALPLIEEEIYHRDKIRDLRRSIVFQILVATSIPWILVFFSLVFEPGRLSSQLFEPVTYIAVGIALTYEGIGVYAIWKISAFY